MKLFTAEHIILLSIVMPFVASLASLAKPFRDGLSHALVACACLPLASLAIWAWSAGHPVGPAEAGWLLTGLVFGVDEVSSIFLVIAAVLWPASAVYARGYFTQKNPPGRFAFFYYAAMGGNVGLILAQDIVGFYLFFAVMSFSVYGLIIHNRTPDALRAGRVYIAMAVIGESLLITTLIVIASYSPGLDFQTIRESFSALPSRELVIGLVIAAFAIKAGVVPLHIWLPLAHPAAPAPASAVLSGVVIKAGLIGWMRLLPVGMASFPGLGAALAAVGVFSAFYAVLIGVTQKEPKAVLAYSSISQMGLAAIAMGLALGNAGVGKAGLSVLLAFALHHSLAKGALFLGTGLLRYKWRSFVLAGLAVPAISLAGAPFTSGAASKAGLKALMHAPGVYLPFFGEWLLAASSVATTMLMARFLHVSYMSMRQGEEDGHNGAGWVSVVALVVVIGASVTLFTLLGAGGPAGKQVTLSAVIGGTWTVALGVVAYAVFRMLGRALGVGGLPSVPPGDILAPLTHALKLVRPIWQTARFQPVLQGALGSVNNTLTNFYESIPPLVDAGERFLAAGRLPWLIIMLITAVLVLIDHFI